jgi:Bacterial mobilisation protein (MobC)
LVRSDPKKKKKKGQVMSTRKKIKAGQTGSWDTHPFLRNEKVVLRVSPDELLQMERNRVTHRFDNMAQYLRAQGLKPTPTANERKHLTALLGATFQLNKIGVNINQIARRLNQGESIDDEVAVTLKQIRMAAQAMLDQARNGGIK